MKKNNTKTTHIRKTARYHHLLAPDPILAKLNSLSGKSKYKKTNSLKIKPKYNVIKELDNLLNNKTFKVKKCKI